MRKLLALVLLAWLPLAGAETWSFAIIGDTPYSNWERRELPAMLEAMAEVNASLVAHVGDIKSGGDRCDDSLFTDRKEVFDASRIPVVLVPGDNEWADCDRVSNGAYDPLERLGKLRNLFWGNGHSLGHRPIPLERQPGTYPEHARFRLGPVLFVSLNVPGSDNNWGMAPAPRAEFLSRNPVVLAWMKEGFAIARQERLAGVVFMMQANPDFKRFSQGLPHRGFREILETLREETLNFPGRVLLIHGDTHHHRIDHPLRDRDGRVIERFTRVETFGYPFMGWVHGFIDTAAPGLFRFASHPWPAR